MSVQSVRPIGFRVAAVLLCLGLFGSCEPSPGPEPTPTPETPPNPKEALLQAFPDADAGSFHFALSEDDAQITSTLTNEALREPVRLGEGDSTLVLRYARVEDRAGAAKTYKTELTKKGSKLFVVAEGAAGDVVFGGPFDPPGDICNPPGQFESLEACIEEFNCSMKGPILCKANRTCQPQFVGLVCCLTSGQMFSVHMLIPPDSFRCRLIQTVIPDFGSFVLSRG